MTFFDSSVVQNEIAEITKLQEEVYENVFKFPSMTKEEKIEHVNLLEKLIEKQRVMYTRLSLSNDPEAIQMKENIANSARDMGMSRDVDINQVFANMGKLIVTMRDQIDKGA
tara:strand:- start:47 stop:382 length:336 start_codon:yes stop_codon:yes gene_type:complete